MNRAKFPSLQAKLYIPPAILEELRVEAKRQQRSVAWLLREAWRLARERMRARPGEEDDA